MEGNISPEWFHKLARNHVTLDEPGLATVALNQVRAYHNTRISCMLAHLLLCRGLSMSMKQSCVCMKALTMSDVIELSLTGDAVPEIKLMES